EPGHERVVITGVGALTPAGTTPAALWEAVAAGRDCTADEGGTRIGRVDLDAGAFLSAKARRRMDRLGVFSVVASKLALASATLEPRRSRTPPKFSPAARPTRCSPSARTRSARRSSAHTAP